MMEYHGVRAEERELIEHLDRLLVGFAGESDLKVGSHMLVQGIEEAKDTLESLISDRAKLREALEKASVFLKHGSLVNHARIAALIADIDVALNTTQDISNG